MTTMGNNVRRAALVVLATTALTTDRKSVV